MSSAVVSVEGFGSAQYSVMLGLNYIPTARATGNYCILK